MNPETIERDLKELFHASEGSELFLSAFEHTSRFGSRKSPAPEIKSFWSALKKEVYDLLCTASPKYKKERDALAKTPAPAIGVLTAFLTSNFGLAAGTATALAAAALLVPFKLVLRSWCQTQILEDLPSSEEIKALKSIARKKHPR